MPMKHKLKQANYINLSEPKRKKNGHLKKRTTQSKTNKIKRKKLKYPKSNQSNRAQEAMKHLVKSRDIIITTVDKGRAVRNMGTEN